MEYRYDDSAYGIFTQIIRLHYHRTHESLEKLGIYPGQPPLLFEVAHRDGLSQKELCERLHIKPATITVMLQRMESAGLFERRQDLNDQRISRVYLTEHGKKVVEEVKIVTKEIEEECFSNFTQEEKVLIRRLFMQIRDNLAYFLDKNIEE